MKNSIKIFVIILGFASISLPVKADRGGKKPASRVLLNIGSASAFGTSIFSKYNSGLHYTGSVLLNSTFNNSTKNVEKTMITTFQKGNTIYIQAYKQVVIVPDYKQGYGGVKVIFKPY